MPSNFFRALDISENSELPKFLVDNFLKTFDFPRKKTKIWFFFDLVAVFVQIGPKIRRTNFKKISFFEFSFLNLSGEFDVFDRKSQKVT